MSALQEISPGSSATGPIRELDRLVQLIIPCLTRIMRSAVRLPILNEEGSMVMVFYAPLALDNLYVVSSKGLAKRPLSTELPKLIRREAYAAIGTRGIWEIIGMLQAIIDHHDRIYRENPILA